MAGAGRGDSGQGGGSDDSDATTARLNALAQAKADGRFGSDSQPIVTSPATGWAGEQVVNPKVDDWEPAVATDPHSGYAYILTTRYGTGPTCQAHCPTPYIALTVSSNNGATWGKQVPLWGVKGSNAQYDPTIEVVPSTGVVYACFLDADRHNGFSLLFIKSTDHGKTWGNPVRPNGRVSWTDKDDLSQRQGRLRVLERPDRGRPLDGCVARLRRHLDADARRRQQAILLRLRRQGPARRNGDLLREQLPVHL
jgi:hypothetical protein